MSDPDTDKQTVTAFISQVLRKAEVKASDAVSITLEAGFRAFVTVYVTDAAGAKVFNRESKECEFRQVEVPILWDNDQL